MGTWWTSAVAPGILPPATLVRPCTSRTAALALASLYSITGAMTNASAAAPIVNPPSSSVTVAAPSAPDKIAALEARIARLEQLLESQALADMLGQLTKLQAETQRLNGDAELQTHEIDGLKKRQRDAYLDIDRRLRDIEKGLVAKEVEPAVEKNASPAIPPAAPAPQSTTPPGAALPPAANAVDVSREQIMYQRALDALKKGRHDQAISDFQDFLTHYPKSEFASNAYYWLGEANYATRHYEVAITHFKKVINTYSGSSKVADSTLKLGFAYHELGEREQARKTLNDVVSRYPNTRVAQSAAERLQKIKSDSN